MNFNIRIEKQKNTKKLKTKKNEYMNNLTIKKIQQQPVKASHTETIEETETNTHTHTTKPDPHIHMQLHSFTHTHTYIYK